MAFSDLSMHSLNARATQTVMSVCSTGRGTVLIDSRTTHEGSSTAQQCVHVLNALSVCVHVLNSLSVCVHVLGTGTRGTESATSGSVTDTMVRTVEALCLNSYNLKTPQGMRRRLMMLPRPANGSSRSLALSTSVRYALPLLKPRLSLGQERSSCTLDSLYFCLTVLYCLDQNKRFWGPVNVAHTCGVCIEFSRSS